MAHFHMGSNHGAVIIYIVKYFTVDIKAKEKVLPLNKGQIALMLILTLSTSWKRVIVNFIKTGVRFLVKRSSCFT